MTTTKKSHLLLICLALALATLATFWQLRHNDFITVFDDDLYIVDNSYVKAGLTLKGLVWAMTAEHAFNWHPLTWLSHMLDCQVFDVEPGAHHFTNLLFHIANALLLFLVLNRMTGNLWCSAFVAAVFALHPLHVESVAWASERKDTLSTLFWMLTIWAYLRYVEQPRAARYVLMLLLFATGLTAKQMLVTLPFVLLLLDYWPLGRVTLKGHNIRSHARTLDSASIRRCILEKLPLFTLSAAASVTVFLVQEHTGVMKSLTNFPLPLRIANALVSYVVYIEKMLWPSHLAVFYPHPLAGQLPAWKIIGAALLLLAITAAAIWNLRRRPYLAIGWLWYLGTLAPVIGLVQVGNQAFADRYTYVTLTGLFVMIAWGAGDLLTKWKYRRTVLGISILIVLSALSVRTHLQLRHWSNGITLFEHTIRVTEDNYLARIALARCLQQQGELDDAIKQFEQVLRIRPKHSEAHNDLAAALVEKGSFDKAIMHFEEAIQIDPNLFSAHYNLAQIFAKTHRIDQAIIHFEQALRINPDLAGAHKRLARILLQLGKPDKAITHYRQTLRIDPFDPNAHNDLGVALRQKNNLDEAIKHFNEALHIKPNLGEAHVNLGAALLRQRKYDNAIEHYTLALRAKPDWPEVYFSLGKVYYLQRRFDLSVKQHTQALRLKPDFLPARIHLAQIFNETGKLKLAVKHYYIILESMPDRVGVLNNLAWILAATQDSDLQNPADAVKFAQKACELTNYQRPSFLDTLAVAYAAAGRFTDAVQTAQKAIKAADDAGKKDLARQIQNRLQLYEVGQPYHEP